MYKCPHCENEIEYLDYDIRCTEYGTYYPSGRDHTDGDYDEGSTERDGDYEYSCPECGDSVLLNTLREADEDVEEEEETASDSLTEEIPKQVKSKTTVEIQISVMRESTVAMRNDMAFCAACKDLFIQNSHSDKLCEACS